MELRYNIVLIAACMLLLSQVSFSQEQKITNEYKQEVIDTLSRMIVDHYVFPDIAETTKEHLLTQVRNGHFEEIQSDSAFAIAITESVQAINNDKHMRIYTNPPFEAPENSLDRKIEKRLHGKNRVRVGNSGFKSAEIMEGNVGYLDLRFFDGLNTGKDVADSYMKLFSNTDAMIIDLRMNGGGDPDMVQYLCSYFFDEVLHLNSLYFRAGDRTMEFWTLEEVGGEKLSDIPLFVLTSGGTFSGAEEFSYNMQTQKRASLVGETTGGGANPGQFMSLNDHLGVFIPTGRAINPITKTNWEGIGVIPDIKTPSLDALVRAHELARDAAESFREETRNTHKKMLSELYTLLNSGSSENSDESIHDALNNCIGLKLMDEAEINMTGYEYLMEHKKMNIALSIFRANTILFPNSANVYDSYAESLMMDGKLDLSLENHTKAVNIAEEQGHRDLELFKANLMQAQEKIKKGDN